jgi:hypothetical protein
MWDEKCPNLEKYFQKSLGKEKTLCYNKLDNLYI